MTSPWIWPRPATSRPSNCKRASFMFPRTTPDYANKTALDKYRRGLITVWKQPKAEVVPLPWASSGHRLRRETGCLPRPPSRRPATARRHGSHGGHSKVILFDEPLRPRSSNDEVLGLMKQSPPPAPDHGGGRPTIEILPVMARPIG